MMEVRQETDYVLHHAQKVISIFAAMRAMAAKLRADGHRVHYISISEPESENALVENIAKLSPYHWLQRILNTRSRMSGVWTHCSVNTPPWPKPPGTHASRMVSSEHFFTGRLGDEADVQTR